MNLSYEAIDGYGRNVTDVVEAPSVREAVESLRASLGKLASLDEPPSPDCREPRCGVR